MLIVIVVLYRKELLLNLKVIENYMIVMVNLMMNLKIILMI